MNYLLYFILGLLPSIIWLLFYLRKDVHPEPKRQVIKIFLYGMVVALPAIFIEKGILEELLKLSSFISENLILLLNVFIGTALVEEILKYLVVKEMVLGDPEFDEPLDVILYMIISALGFAALENLLIFLSPEIFLIPIGETLILVFLRFISATFLHALCSGLAGFFLALSFLNIKNRIKLTGVGLGLAIIFHGIYNFAIIIMKGRISFIIPAIILISLAFIISLGFKKLEKMKSICLPADANYHDSSSKKEKNNQKKFPKPLKKRGQGGRIRGDD